MVPDDLATGACGCNPGVGNLSGYTERQMRRVTLRPVLIHASSAALSSEGATLLAFSTVAPPLPLSAPRNTDRAPVTLFMGLPAMVTVRCVPTRDTDTWGAQEHHIL
jgi:hypothetical protein